jgi:hypothetical protein
MAVEAPLFMNILAHQNFICSRKEMIKGNSCDCEGLLKCIIICSVKKDRIGIITIVFG